MNLDALVFFKAFLIAAFIHFAGFYIIQIKGDVDVAYPFIDIVYVDDLSVLKKSPPAVTSDEQTLIPSFISLPEGSTLNTSVDENFNIKNMSYFAFKEDEDLFRNAHKMIADEAFFFESELDANKFLPIKNKISKYIPLETDDTDKGIKSSGLAGYQFSYFGKNKEVILHRYKNLLIKIEDIQQKPLKALVLNLSFSEKNELISCRLDKSSNTKAFDQEVIRILKSYIKPLSSSSQVASTGRFSISWSGDAK